MIFQVVFGGFRWFSVNVWFSVILRTAIWRRPIYSRVNDEGSRSHTRFAEWGVLWWCWGHISECVSYLQECTYNGTIFGSPPHGAFWEWPKGQL